MWYKLCMKNKHKKQIQSKLFTLKKANFEEIKKLLSSLDQTSSVYHELAEIVADYQELTLLVYAAINRQRTCADGLFKALDEKASLFPKFPLPEMEDEDAGQTPSNTSPDAGHTPQDANASSEPISTPKEPKNQPHRPPKKVTKKIAHALDPKQLSCPDCGKTMHKAHKKCVTIIRMTTIAAEHHEMETARCLSCETTVEAAGPNEKTVGSFALPCGAVLATLRYAYGMPAYRLEEVTASLGYTIPDSTQWDLYEKIANRINPFYRFLVATAAQAPGVHIDDTYVNILSMRAILKNMGVNDDPFQLATPSAEGRTGLHTTALRTFGLPGPLCLFDSGRHHAGEVFEKTMALRRKATQQEKPIVLMADALAANTSRLKHMDTPVDVANCNSHVVRKFKELKDNPLFEEPVDTILALYEEIFQRDKTLKHEGASPAHRLQVHKDKSWPQMVAIKTKILEDLGRNPTPPHTKPAHKVEPNSALGKAYQYILNHFDKLCAFCHREGAPLCNNAAERMLKRAIRHRKNSLFYKNEMGALVGDIMMTVLISAIENGLEPVQYLTDLLQHPELWKTNPEAWLPWHIQETKKALVESQNQTPQEEGFASIQHSPHPKRACEHHHHTTP